MIYSLILALAFGYLLGSIPFGLLLTRAAGLGDVRNIGSGNIGATNVLRTGNKGLAAATLLLDALKGTAAVLIAGHFAPDLAVWAGLGAFLGHLFPVWLGFKGGKGVATYLGVLIGLAWQVALIFAVVWLVMALLFRFSSLAALVAAVVVPIALYFLSTPRIAVLFVAMSVIVFIKHRANISRLLAGSEGKIGAKGVSDRATSLSDRATAVSEPAAGPRLSDRQRLSWLRLIRTPNVGPASFRDLINRFGSAEAALEILPELMISGGASRIARIPSIAEAEAEMEAARRAGARFVGIGEPDYPRLLLSMDNPPPLLAVKGNAAVFRLPGVAIVGARNASLAGIKMARMLAADLGGEGYGIVSGLARGIDTAAHQGSLSTGTIGVLAGGLDQPYPPENAGLCDDIAERGAIISEMPFGWQPRAQDFPRRNRLVAGAALGLVVIEAAQRSGSLISARLAGEMGRLVFAVPGSPLDPRAAGTNGLLKDGATLVTEAADISRAIAPLTGMRAPDVPPFEDPPDFSVTPPPGESDRARVLEALGPTPVPVDEIIRHTGLHPAQVFMVLLELDLAGRLERHAGGQVSLVFGEA